MELSPTQSMAPPLPTNALRQSRSHSHSSHHLSSPVDHPGASYPSLAIDMADLASLEAREAERTARPPFDQSRRKSHGTVQVEPPASPAPRSYARPFSHRGSSKKGNDQFEKESTDLAALEAGERQGSNFHAQQHRSVPLLPRRNVQMKHMFGIGRQMRSQLGLHGNNMHDYEQKYPADEIYEEMGPNARVWRVYLDEAEAFDTDMIEGWKDTIDVLLVFAGLFSAVVSTFVVQTAQALQPDYSQITASLLTELVSLQRTAALGQSVDVVPHSVLNATSAFSAEATDRWVNALWFTSLSFSLATALISVLVKQWLQHYVSAVSGVASERVHIRQFRFHGLEKWHVRGIIGWLPVLMHLSLMIFFVGLVVFLHPLDMAISWVVTGIAIFAYLAYFVTNILPLLCPDCPYKTPLTYYMNLLFHQGSKLMISLSKQSWAGTYWIMVFILRRRPSWTTGILKPMNSVSSLRDQELAIIRDMAPILDVDSLLWLSSASSNPTVMNIVFQAISALQNIHVSDPLVKPYLLPRMAKDLDNQCDHLSESDDDEKLVTAERMARALLKLHLSKTLYHDHLNPFGNMIEWHTWEDMITIGRKKDACHLTVLGYCGLLVSSNNHRKEYCLADMTEMLRRHISNADEIPSHHLELFIRCLTKMLDNSASQIYFNWEFTLLLYELLGQQLVQHRYDYESQTIKHMIQCLYLLIHRCFGDQRAQLLKETKRQCGKLLDSDLGKGHSKLVYLDIINHIMASYEEWFISDTDKSTMNMVLGDICTRFTNFLVTKAPIESSELRNSLVKDIHSSLGALARSSYFVSTMMSGHGQMLTLTALTILEDTPVAMNTVCDIQFMENLLHCPNLAASQELGKQMLIHLKKCIKADAHNCYNFSIHNGIEALQKAENMWLNYNKFAYECYEIILQLFCYAYSESDETQSFLSMDHDTKAEFLKYILNHDHLIWCFHVLCTNWTPEPATVYMKKIHLLEMFSLSDDKQIWLIILGDLIQRTRHIRMFNQSVRQHYLADFDILEQLKRLLDVDPRDEQFILYEYTTFISHRQEALDSYVAYPEAIAVDSHEAYLPVIQKHIPYHGRQ